MPTLPDPPRVLLASDKYKGSASASEVVEALARGIATGAPRAEVVRCPIADGGDGTVDALLASGHEPLTVPSADTFGRDSTGVVAARGSQAVVELASLCGLAVAGERVDPLAASSRGVGHTVRQVLDWGFRDVIVGLGGSASTDGGLGFLMALGARAEDRDGQPVTPDGHGLMRVARIDLDEIWLPARTRLRVACDVDAPLHGPDGAAVTFGPQKGASPGEVADLDRALARWGSLLAGATGRDVTQVPGAGAAGGVGAALLAIGAEVVSGSGLVLDAVGFDDHVRAASLVVTGEGAWDSQSMRGKGPGEVMRRAGAAGVPVVLVAGQVQPGSTDGLRLAAVHSLTQVAGSVAAATAAVATLLERVGATIALELPTLLAFHGLPDARGAAVPSGWSVERS